MTRRTTRREFTMLAAAGAAGMAAGAAAPLTPAALAQTSPPPRTVHPIPASIVRLIPNSGESLPVVGLGTAQVFDSDDAETRTKAAAVVRALAGNGGRLIDTASTYGDAESVLGEVIAAAGLRDKLFIATKLESPDDAELQLSLKRLRTAKLDLLQLHNVRDPQQSLARFRDWKAQGVCRYFGMTSTYHRDYPAFEAVLAREKPDFMQVDYSLEDREAEKRILPLAAQVNAAVLTALPFGRGRLFRSVRGKALPDWAAEFAGSWGQFFLKFLLTDERVTAVIPGTSDPGHMIDNLGAMRGPLPDAGQRKRMIDFAATL